MLLVARWQERWPSIILHLLFEHGQGLIHVRNRILRVCRCLRTPCCILLSTVSAWAAWGRPAGIYICTIVDLGPNSWGLFSSLGVRAQGEQVAPNPCSRPFGATAGQPEYLDLLHTRSVVILGSINILCLQVLIRTFCSRS